MPDPTWAQRGRYEKWRVVHKRSPARHVNCTVFVLDPAHDRFAIPALETYADVVESENALLAADLRYLAEVSAEPERVYAGPSGKFVVEPGMHWDPREAVYCGCGTPGTHY